MATYRTIPEAGDKIKIRAVSWSTDKVVELDGQEAIIDDVEEDESGQFNVCAITSIGHHKVYLRIGEFWFWEIASGSWTLGGWETYV